MSGRMPDRLSVLDRICGVALSLSAGTLLLNLLGFHPVSGVARRGGNGSLPMVSILVPARNEERSIEACVHSLLAQRYSPFEVLVLDDCSGDTTAVRLAGFSDPRLRVLHGAPLPPGWGGKNWACHQLAVSANPRSRYFLFTDADTVHAPGVVAATVAEAEQAGLALLSLMPEQLTGSLVEQAVIPLLPLQILAFLPLFLAERAPFPALAAANGQYLLFRREAYQEMGGHGAQPLTLAEDVALAQRVKAHGGRVRLANGTGLVQCRMYRSAGEVAAGFRRSFAGGFHLNPPISALMLLVNALAYLVPFLRAARSSPARRLVVAVLGLRLILSWRSRATLASVLLHPAGMALLLSCQVAGAFDAFVRGQSEWKGRRYRKDETGRKRKPVDGR